MNQESESSLVNVMLVRSQRSRVKDLRGFKKTHQVPTEFNEHTNSFVGRLAAVEISEDLDLRFSDFRKTLKFKRVDMNVSEPDGGVGTIVTPWFDYQISATLADDDSTEVIWRRQISEFRKPDAIASAELSSAFGNLFDTVELLPPCGIDVSALIDVLEDVRPMGVTLEYDRTATWCDVGIAGIAGQVRLTSDLLALQVHQPQSPARLLESFVQVRTQFAGIEGL